jgi:hypothetical protein
MYVRVSLAAIETTSVHTHSLVTHSWLHLWYTLIYHHLSQTQVSIVFYIL